MAPALTGNRIYDAAIAAAEGVRQSAVKAAGNNQAAVKAAEIAFYQTCRAAAQANGISFAQFAEALQELAMPNTF